ncbi:hypothetical protein X777_01454 [Ooceraea biroi]|uniref:Uncharacterized protein n=1 Tax=Ooceraea biroi TaxID=2015173 RepID=A0A026WQ23_OOCBI|nr:hypothetical protein X777_01454 [Ooceraea biroi]
MQDTRPLLFLRDRNLPVLPSRHNALSARPCPGQWLSMDYVAPKKLTIDNVIYVVSRTI